jgi:hypothetical protein
MQVINLFKNNIAVKNVTNANYYMFYENTATDYIKITLIALCGPMRFLIDFFDSFVILWQIRVLVNCGNFVSFMEWWIFILVALAASIAANALLQKGPWGRWNRGAGSVLEGKNINIYSFPKLLFVLLALQTIFDLCIP